MQGEARIIQCTLLPEKVGIGETNEVDVILGCLIPATETDLGEGSPPDEVA